MDLAGKKFLITGASGGMGFVLCEELVKQGAVLALCSNDEERLNQLDQQLQQGYGCEPFVHALDITNESEVADFFAAAEESIGKFDGMVNLAGLSIPGNIETTEASIYDTLMDVNVKGAFFAGKHFAAHSAEEAQIINIGSMAARRANGNAPLYCTAKAAVNMLSQTMAIQMAKKNIRVTTLNPGGADTPFWGDRPVNRAKLMKASDVVEVIMFVLKTNARVAIHSIDFECAETLK